VNLLNLQVNRCFGQTEASVRRMLDGAKAPEVDAVSLNLVPLSLHLFYSPSTILFLQSIETVVLFAAHHQAKTIY